MARECWAIVLGETVFEDTAELQKKLCFRRAYGDIPDVLLLTEHEHVYTAGGGAKPEHLALKSETTLETVKTDRGGGVTYHGPGQLVAYPILDLGMSPDMNGYLRDLEEVMIRTLSSFNIKARRVRGLTGVWVGRAKIGSIGVKITGGITKHGFSLNVDPDLGYFENINACGFDRPSTSMAAVLGCDINFAGVEQMVIDRFSAVFDRKIIPVRAGALDQKLGEAIESNIGLR